VDDYWAGLGDPGTPNEFQVAWGGIYLLDVVNLAPIGWVEYSLTATASGSTTYFVVKGYANILSEFGFDDVSVSVKPPPAVASVSNLRASQHSSGALVDLFYDLTGNGSAYTASVTVSSDAGASFTAPATHFTGDGVTSPTSPGTGLHIVWDAGADFPGQFSTKMRLKLMVASAFALSPIFTVDTREVPTGTLTGLVEGSGAPVANAQVRIDGTTFATTTGPDGQFTLANVPAGSGYLLKVSAAGYASKQLPGITVTSGTKDLGTIQLATLGGPYRLVPLQPDVNPSVTQIEDGGVGYRYYRLMPVNANDNPGGTTVSLRIAGGATIPQDGGTPNDWQGYQSAYWPGYQAGTADSDGTIRLRIPVSAIGGPGASATLEVVESGVVKQTFTAQVVPRQYEQVWKQELGAGVSVGDILTAGAETDAESEVRHAIAGGSLVGETITRERTVDGQAGVGVGVGSSLTVSSSDYNFAAGAQAGAQADAFVAFGFRSTCAFDPDSTDAGQNAMKLYVDLGNVLSGVPGPQSAFYDFVDSTIAPLLLEANLQSVEGDIQLGAGAEGQVVFGSGIAGPVAVNFQADASVKEQAIFGQAVTLGSSPETATVVGVAASGSAMASGGVALGIANLPGLSLAGAQFDWATSADVEMLREAWTRKGQSSPYRTELVRKVGLSAGQQNPVAAWQKYDPAALYGNYERQFTETVGQRNGDTMASYDWSVYAGQQQFGANLNLDLGMGVSLQGELDQGAEIINERGTIAQSRYWPTESYPAITPAQLPTQSLFSLVAEWGTYASGTIGQALSAFATEVASGVDTVIQAGSAAVLRIGQGAMNAGSWIVTRFVPGGAGGGHVVVHYRPRGHAPKGDSSANLVYGIGGIYRFESTNSFNGTGTLTIAYSPVEVSGFNPSDLRMYYLPDGTNRWQFVGGTVNLASNTVTAPITQLGTADADGRLGVDSEHEYAGGGRCVADDNHGHEHFAEHGRGPATTSLQRRLQRSSNATVDVHGHGPGCQRNEPRRGHEHAWRAGVDH
jgi:hypothetical protein